MTDFQETNKFEEFEDAIENTFPENDIFHRIVSEPKAAFQLIHKFQYEKHVTLLLFLAGISRAFDQASNKSTGDNLPLWGVIGVSVIFGGLFGWISYYFYAALVSWMGKWLGGTADTKSVLRVTAYGMFPSAVALVLIIPEIAIFGNDLFRSDRDVTSYGVVSSILFYGIEFLNIGLGLWSLVLCTIGIAVVQKFSLGKAFLNFLLPALVFIAIILGLLVVTGVFN